MKVIGDFTLKWSVFMKSIFRFFITVIALMISGIIKPVISKAIISLDNSHKVAFFGDRHFDKSGKLVGPVQKKHILEQAQMLNYQAKSDSDKVFLIVEDNLFYDGDHADAKEFIDSMSAYAQKKFKVEESDSADDSDDIEVIEGSVLDNIAHDSINMGIDCYNAECRQLKYASECDGCVTGKEVVKESERVIQEMLHELQAIKNDAQSGDSVAQIINDECMKIIELAKKSSKYVTSILKDSDLSIEQLLKKQKIENPMDSVGLYDTYLIDARILIAWYKNRDRKNCFIITGGCHQDRILPVFEKLGHQRFEFGKSYPLNKSGTIAMIQNRIKFNEFFQDVYPTLDVPKNESFFEGISKFIISMVDGIKSTFGLS